MSETNLQHHKIFIKNAYLHNLKNINVAIPHNKLVVITGISGSGKSTLAYDTLFAEGQRRYVESLSSYARQFLGKISKPDVDFIENIPPAIAIEQKVNARNPRSTVGTITEIYDYLKILYARIGKTFSPLSGQEVKRHTVTDVVNFIMTLPPQTEVTILAPCKIIEGKSIEEHINMLIQQGFSRIALEEINFNNNNNIITLLKINDLLKNKKELTKIKNFYIVIDRIIVDNTLELTKRLGDSVQIAYNEGNETCLIIYFINEKLQTNYFSNRFEADNMLFKEPSVHLLTFNNPIGACKLCEGFGKIIGIDEDLVVPNKNLSVYDGAISCWTGDKMIEWKNYFIMNAPKYNFPIHKPYYALTEEQKAILWNGKDDWKGINGFFKWIEEQSYKIQYRVMLARYRGKTTCPDCKGKRLRKEATYIKINHKAITDLLDIPLTQLYNFITTLTLNETDYKIAERILIEIKSRLKFLIEVGVGYLNLSRLVSTLSGGEIQRIRLASSLGNNLTGSLYVLDEPSIGLHNRDTIKLINILKNLRNLGNTVVVVEHDEEIMKAADEIIDMGPFAGRNGGEIVFQGSFNNLIEASQSLTAKYLTEQEKIPVPSYRRKWNNYILLKGCKENNLKGIDVKFPLHTLIAITGVSGSGKTTLIRQTLYPILKKTLTGTNEKAGLHEALIGDYHLLKEVDMVDQNAMGKSSRSNPVTYLKAYDDIRKLFTQQQQAKYFDLTPSHFSFNVDGGRCEECLGDGYITVEMQFMADVKLVCESCQGKRFKDIILEVRYNDKNIYEVLEMTVDEAIVFFQKKNSDIEKKIIKKLELLSDVGLGYIKLGQSSSTLSGGECQRLKLASFLDNEVSGHCLYIFDEPTIGLHFYDINKLLGAFESLIKKGHSIIVIEHNLDIIKCADWVIDLGKEGGEEGGYIVAEGTPEDIANCPDSYTGRFLKNKLQK